MAQVFSAVCWGGLAGKSVTVNATTDLVTLTDHGLRNGKGVAYTSGSLPTVSGTALALNTTYYAKWISTSTFELYYEQALTTKINFTSTGSSLVLKSALMLALTTDQKARYGSPGSERIYGSFSAINAARSTASIPGNDDVWEFLEAFDDFIASQGNLAYGLADSTLLTSTMDGVRTEAFHGGFPGLGYSLTGGLTGCFYHGSNNIGTDGLDFCRNSATSAAYDTVSMGSVGSYLINCIVRQTGAGNSRGIGIGGPVFIANNIVMGFGDDYGGIYNLGASGSTVAHNLVTKCGTAFKSSASCSASVYNNVSVGNTINWGVSPTYAANRFRGNIGALTDKLGVTVTSGTTTMICASSPALLVTINQPVFFETTGTLPTVGGVALDPTKPYYIRSISGSNITIATTYNGFAVTFNGTGTGTHSMRLVWASYDPVTAWIDFSDPSLVFVDWANNDFRPAGTGATPAAEAKMVDYSIVTSLVDLTTDIAGNERPNYNNGGAEYKDAGPFEYDRGYGPHPTSNYRGLAFVDLIAGSTLKVFETGTDTELFSTTSAATTETWSENVSGSRTVDYTVLKDGYIPIRVVGITVTGATTGGVVTTPIQQKISRAYQTSSGLAYGTTATVNTGTSEFAVSVNTTIQNFYSFCCEAWRTETALKNRSFPLSENGPNSFQLSEGWVFTAGSLQYLSRDGMRTVSSPGVVTGVWAAILSVGVPAGMQVRYQQQDGSGTANAANTGNIDQLVKVYEDGVYDYRGHLVLKVQAEGYDQAEFDLVATFGTLEDQFYVAALSPTANGIASGVVTGVTITDHAALPVTWNSKSFSVTITDTTGHTGNQILQYVRGLNNFNYHDLVQTNGTEFKTVRGKLYGDTGATLKGVRVVQSDGTTSHTDFNLHTSDDGTTYIPPIPPASASATILAGSRVQLYNVTTATEIDNVFVVGTSYTYVVTTEASVGDVLRLRVCKLGREAGEALGVWGALGVEFLISQPASSEYATWGIDGSSITEFTGDVTGHIYIDANDLDGATTKTRLGAWYSWVLTTEIGIRNFYNGVTYVSSAAIRINVDVSDILIENTNPTTALRFTDLAVRLYRSDGSSVIAPTSYSIHNDYSGTPDVVETGVSGLTGAESAQLMGLPSSVLNASATVAALQAVVTPVNIVEVAGQAIVGGGTEANPWGPV